MRTYTDAEIITRATATEEFRQAYCAGWPATYAAMLPVTTEGKEFAQAFERIRKLMAADFAAMQAEQESPWVKTGPEPKMVDWSGLTAKDKIALGERRSRETGMPAPVKIDSPDPGKYQNLTDGLAVYAAFLEMPDNPYRQHPAVTEAESRKRQTAEWVAMVAERQAFSDFLKAERELASAVGDLPMFIRETTREGGQSATTTMLNPALDRQKIQPLVDAIVKTRKLHDKAKSEFDRLRATTEKGLRIVRGPLSAEELAAEEAILASANKPTP